LFSLFAAKKFVPENIGAEEADRSLARSVK